MSQIHAAVLSGVAKPPLLLHHLTLAFLAPCAFAGLALPFPNFARLLPSSHCIQLHCDLPLSAGRVGGGHAGWGPALGRAGATC